MSLLVSGHQGTWRKSPRDAVWVQTVNQQSACCGGRGARGPAPGYLEAGREGGRIAGAQWPNRAGGLRWSQGQPHQQAGGQPGLGP